MRQKLFLIMMGMVLIAGCGGKVVKPDGLAEKDWLDGTSKRYSNLQYVVGTGQSYGLDSAKDRARADVAKVFEVAVEEQSRDNMEFLSDASGDNLVQRITRDTTLKTSKILRGVEIADTWHDKKQGQYHALAVLHRGRTARTLRQEIAQLDQATNIHINKAKSTNDKLIKLTHGQAAFTIQMERAGLQRTLQVVDNSGNGVRPRWNLAQLSTDFRQQMERVKIEAVVAEQPVGFKQMVTGALGATGFQVQSGQTPDFILTTSLELGSPTLREGWYWIDGRMELLLSTPDGRVRGSKRWSIKASATQKSAASKRAMDKAGSILKSELKGTILGFAE